MNIITDTINRLKNDCVNTIEQHLNAMKYEVVNDSPVLTGYFKSQWRDDIDFSKFKFRMWNDTSYGLRLWRYHHSKKGWSPITGDAVVRKHSQNLSRALRRLNNINYYV